VTFSGGADCKFSAENASFRKQNNILETLSDTMWLCKTN